MPRERDFERDVKRFIEVCVDETLDIQMLVHSK
uniref:Uncharacterized protein n=1 Tax=viral metagenome TaxID=1070528 RepID=A0A6C0C9C4_9ZZZZ